MDINLLVLSVGNTRVALGVFIAGELTHSARVPIALAPDLPAAVAAGWALLEKTESPVVVAASVNPGFDGAIESAVRAAAGLDVLWVGHDADIPLPIAVRTDPPEQTGVDRVLNVAAAFEQLQKACVVVDAGTALTISVCSDTGEFLGGAIAPGMQMCLDALHAGTARLPRITFERPPADPPYGANTTDAIRHALYFGARGLLREVTENFASTLGTWPEVIATGGDAHALFGDLDIVHAISPDLTLYGLALAYTNHKLADIE